MRLWESIHREYKIQDAGGVEMLASACASLDRAEQLHECIDAEDRLSAPKAASATTHC
jgi:hypothetical protein